MRWRVYKIWPGVMPSENRRWISAPAGGFVVTNRPKGRTVLGTGLRYHHTHAEALQRAIVKAYGPQPRKETP